MKSALIFVDGYLTGFLTLFAIFVFDSRSHPPTPTIPPATAITVMLYPLDGIGSLVEKPVDIPPEKFDQVLQLITPEQYFSGGIRDFGQRIVAEVTITHADGKQTFVMVRDFGHNPALVSVDGRNYFFARNDPDVHAGANQLIQLVGQLAHPAKPVPPTAP